MFYLGSLGMAIYIGICNGMSTGTSHHAHVYMYHYAEVMRPPTTTRVEQEEHHVMYNPYEPIKTRTSLTA